MIKVLFISPYYPPYVFGGAEISSALYISHASRFAKFDILTGKHKKKPWLHDGTKVYPILKITKIDKRNILSLVNYGLGILFDPWINLIRVLFFLHKKKIDVLHIVPNTYLNVGIILVARIAKLPMIIDVRDCTWICMTDFSYDNNEFDPKKKHNCFKHVQHNYQVNNKYLKSLSIVISIFETVFFRFYMWIIKKSIESQKNVKICAISGFIRERLISAGFQPSQIEIVRNIMQPMIKTDLKRKKVLIFAGRIEKSKGIYDLLQAFHELNLPNFSLSIYGDGTEFNSIQELVLKQKNPCIHIFGKQSQDVIQRAFAEAFAIIAPVRRPEPLGRFVLDSFSTKTPLITTNMGGPQELLSNRLNGLLFKPKSFTELKKAIFELTSDLKLYETIKNNLRILPEEVKTNYILSKREELYKTVISNK